MNFLKRRSFKFFFIFFAGITCSQIISFWQITDSNNNLYIKASAVFNEGYTFFTPSYEVLPSLKQFSSAFYGGFFLTFTTGLFLIFAGVLSGCLLNAFNKYGLSFLLSVFFTGIIAFFLGPYFYWAVIYFFTVLLTILFKPKLKIHPALIMPVLIIFSCLFLYKGNSIFIDVRDKILFNSKAGIKLNNFYYKYTLYPAEIIKNKKHKTLKSANISGFNEQEKTFIKKKIIGYNYFIISKKTAHNDIIITCKNNKVFITANQTQVFDKGIFFKDINKILNEIDNFSNITFFKHTTAAGLILCLPLFLYLSIFYAIVFILQIFLSSEISYYLSCIFISFMIIAILFPVIKFQKTDNSNFKNFLESSNKHQRLQALYFAYSNNKEINNLNKHINSQYIPEACMGILNLKIQSEKDIEILENKLLSQSINIKCKIFKKIGLYNYQNRFLQNKASELLNKNYPTIKDWYVQWYAYTYGKNLILQ